jgi:uncharacterized membrane protein
MNSWYPYIRILHIACGMIALFVAPVAMLTLKGGSTHRRWGKVYFWTMAIVAATAMVMALYRPVIFFALLAMFSFYFAFSGYRSVLRKRERPEAMDWLAALITLAGSLGLIAVGIFPPATQFLPAPIVAITFGLLGIAISAKDIRRWLWPPADRNVWWYNHMGGMLGSYIAAVSAFSAVNFHFLPTAVRWLWPSAIGIPGIFIWIAYYRRKFAGGQNNNIRAAAATR